MDDEMIEYGITCEVCDSELALTVFGVSDTPAYCPMCGSVTNNWEEYESEEDWDD